jgi:hypothetical protein
MHAPNPKFKKKKLIYPYLFRPWASSAKKNLVPYGTGRFRQKKPVPYKTGQKWFDESKRTGRGSEPVGPAGFTGSGSVLVTLVSILKQLMVMLKI